MNKKWTHWKPRTKYLTAALLKFGTQDFTTQDTYELYATHVKRANRTPREMSSWDEMCCRNTFCAAVHQRTAICGAYGIYVLDRIRRGVYRFRKG